MTTTTDRPDLESYAPYAAKLAELHQLDGKLEELTEKRQRLDNILNGRAHPEEMKHEVDAILSGKPVKRGVSREDIHELDRQITTLENYRPRVAAEVEQLRREAGNEVVRAVAEERLQIFQALRDAAADLAAAIHAERDLAEWMSRIGAPTHAHDVADVDIRGYGLIEFATALENYSHKLDKSLNG